MVHRKVPNRGFTLLELLAVLAILGILSGVLFRGRNWFGSGNTTVVSQQITATVQQSRFEAIKRNRRVALFYDAASHQYEIRASNTISDNITDWDCDSDMEVIYSLPLPEGIEISLNPANQHVQWFPTGLAGRCGGSGALALGRVEVAATGQGSGPTVSICFSGEGRTRIRRAATCS
ncbi:MAG: prepilin-type N-terminal cleavage/methylation domain-containing protein [Synechococcaceae cyanobacterium SM2_3_60]|nr:prepilin-type N-terminal cleavage/methylation domain-containing protein [Synechococcaceae cyanobacterium SM2_3_60]